MSMKFGNLLAAGKSLVNGNTAGRYQMEKNFRLPQFISPRNPFQRSASVAPATPPPGVAAPAAKAPSEAGPQVRSAEADAVAKGRNAVLADGAAGAECQSPKRRGVAAVGQRVGAWAQQVVLFCVDHNPFSAIGKPRLAGIPRFGKAAVQGELSLERGPLERNDLRPAELETARVGMGLK